MARSKSVVSKPYRVTLEASHFVGEREFDRCRSLKAARSFALALSADLNGAVSRGAVGVSWVRTRVYIGPHLLSTY